MAVFVTGGLIADIRGSLGDTTFLRTQGGLTARDRATPANPQTDPQTAVRDALTAVSAAWGTLLTETQRTAWRSYAHQHPRPNRWGQRTLTNGYTRFIALNMHRYRDLSAVAFEDPPQRGPMRIPTFVIRASRFGSLVTAEVTNPLTAGTYALTTPYGDRPSWFSAPTAYYIWWEPALTRHRISLAQGEYPAEHWAKSPGPLGKYYPYGGATGNPIVGVDATDPAVEITLPLAGYDPCPNNLRIYAFAGKPTGPGVKYFNGPWTFLDAQTYTGTYETYPWRLIYPYPIAADELVRVRIVVQDLDSGAISPPGVASIQETLFND